jgi:hypothetical protein
MTASKFRDPVRPVSSEILSRLELVSDHISPLLGGTGRRLYADPDPRLSKLQDPTGDKVSYYEHIASVRDKGTDKFYVAFRETADALLARSQDFRKYPEWLMKTTQKHKERMIFIYHVYRHPSKVPILRSHEDWLRPIAADETLLWDTLVFFLSKSGVITPDQMQGVL